jgi:hypothetical protein
VRIDLDGDEVGRGAWRGRVKLGTAGRAEIVTAREPAAPAAAAAATEH